ncbi:MAG TPA: large-conductance mechanosensitive channel protein MscL [Clostridiaceae bacterium]|nr:large-conductance mechanosensitive channel protein MscL [Clostridiaceae bacterium]
MKKFIQDFKSFAMKGNVIDMAVGVIIGGAFGKIVTSLVNDIIMPVLSLVTGKIDLSGLSYPISGVRGEQDYVGIMYGQFLQNVIDFLLIALSMFIVIRLAGKLRRKEEKKEESAEPKLTKDQELLTEIRDLLKNQNP